MNCKERTCSVLGYVMYALGQIMNCKEDMQCVRTCYVCLRADYEL